MLLTSVFAGLQLESFIKLGSPVALVLTGIYILVTNFINKYLFKKWDIQEESLPDLKHFNQKVNENLLANRKKHKCLLKCGIILFVLLCLTINIQIAGNNILHANNILYANYGLKFYDFDDFKQYMAANDEQDYETQKEKNLPYEEEDLSAIEKQFLEKIIYLPGGTIIKYIKRNREVYDVFSEFDRESSGYCIKVIRNFEYWNACDKITLIHCLYSLLYVIEIGGVIIYYMKKRVTFSNKQELPS